MLAFGFIVLGKAIYIQQVQGKYWRSMSDSLHVRYEALNAERGTIYSEDGNMLSTSIPEFDVYIDFAADGLREKNGKRFKENIDSLSINLANLFKDQKADIYKKELQNAYNNEDRYYLLKRKISFPQYQELCSFPLVRLGRNKSGFIASMHTKRLNPYQLLANRTIGLARENAQNVGLEQTYDSLLKGSTGKRLMRYMAGGAWSPVEGSEIEPEDGKDILTTIDVNIQDIAENALMRMMQDNQAEHGTCIVMEVKTGKIKAIANLGRTPNGNYGENYNYAITASEPGSTFKLATLLSVLEDKHVNLNSMVNLEGGVWQVAGRTVYDSEKHGRTDVTVQQAFELSSNVGKAKLAWMYYS
nr:penicillin-binding transpeptidase domain-containing protein [Chitinophagaceae bacterium]